MNPALPSGSVPTGRSPQESDKNGGGVRDKFREFSSSAAAAVGSPWAFAVALVAIVIWAALGPFYKFSDTWQLVINTGTTIVTFLMVFLIQNTQNRDARAIHLKLDELIRAKKGARNKLVDLEDCSEEELQQLEREFKAIRARRAENVETSESQSISTSNATSKRERVAAGK